MNEWIKCTDRLPIESSEEYILFSDGKIVFFGRYFDGNSHDDEFLWKPEIGWIHKNSQITHWMLLPEAPFE